MTESTFDVVANKVWVSRGSVTFPRLSIDLNTTPVALKLGYYPCAGMTFTPRPMSSLDLEDKEVYWWDDKNEKPEHFWRTPDPVRRIRFEIANPPEDYLVKIREAINGKVGRFAPQVRMNEAFIKKFNHLTFYERAQNLLISDKLVIDEPEFLDREGKPYKKIPASYSVFFHMTHIANPQKGGEITMMTEAFWDDGYVSMYGCC